MAVTSPHLIELDQPGLELSLKASEAASGPILSIEAKDSLTKQTIATHDNFGDAPETLHLVLDGETPVDGSWVIAVTGTAFVGGEKKAVSIYR